MKKIESISATEMPEEERGKQWSFRERMFCKKLDEIIDTVNELIDDAIFEQSLDYMNAVRKAEQSEKVYSQFSDSKWVKCGAFLPGHSGSAAGLREQCQGVLLLCERPYNSEKLWKCSNPNCGREIK